MSTLPHNLVRELAGADVAKVYLPPNANPAVNSASSEGNALRPEVAAAADAYFGNPDRLHGDTVSESTIIHEKPIHRMMIWQHAAGATVEEIAERTGYSRVAVGQVLRQPWARERLVQFLNETGRDQVRHFLTHQVAPSLEVLREIRDDKHQKAASRVAAANAILDRALGKPTQHVETENTNRNVPVDLSTLDQQIADLSKQLAEKGHAPGGAN